jgi:hypothetical protein
MRFQVLLLLALLALPLSAAAQTDDIFDLDAIEEETDMSTEEYENVPKGLMIQKTADEEKAEAGAAEAANADADDAIFMSEKFDNIYNDVLAQYRKGDFKQALRGLKFLSKRKHAGAMELLGVMYRMGQGVDKNIALAVDWLTQASEEKKPLALHHLGIMHFNGEGFEISDPMRATMYLNLAIMYYPDGLEKTRAQQDRESISKSLTRRDKENVEEMTREWLLLKNEDELMDQRGR